MIIYTCPRCGCDLTEEVLTCTPPKRTYRCFSCGWCSFDEENVHNEIIRIPWGGNRKVNEEYGNFTNLQTYFNQHEENPCKNCPNHPDNGGSGICHCILGLPKVTC